jgi:murein DD-endopeptidase MepM/ murein hydrolase activator NlpD
MKHRNIKEKRKQRIYLAAGGIAVVAIVAMIGVSMDHSSKDDAGGDSSIVSEAEENAAEDLTALDTANEDSEDNENVVIYENHEDTESEEELTALQTEEETAAQETQQTEEVAAVETISSESTLHFSADTPLEWPVSGEVLMEYSMDHTVYFATLDQYKYNPAVILSGEVNEKIKAAAAGRVSDISTNEETGRTITMDIGDGYELVYGQVKEEQVAVGDYVTAGTVIGYVAQPTKYYASEGSNLYLQMLKDGEAVDPGEFFQ